MLLNLIILEVMQIPNISKAFKTGFRLDTSSTGVYGGLQMKDIIIILHFSFLVSWSVVTDGVLIFGGNNIGNNGPVKLLEDLGTASTANSGSIGYRSTFRIDAAIIYYLIRTGLIPTVELWLV